MKLLDITDYLQAKGVKPSYPRIQIYSYLKDHAEHPTVEEIHKSVVNIIPTLSKTTVYNTLDLFNEKNLVRVLDFGDGEKRYELVLSEHLHFKCELCGQIEDIPIGDLDLLPASYKDYEIKEKHILLKGRCRDCSLNSK